MKIRRDYWLVIVLLFNILVAMVVFGEWFAAVRSYIVFCYLLCCPGLSIAYFIPSEDTVTRVFLVIVISIGIDTLVAMLFLYSGNWSPELILIVLMLISLIGMLSELFFKIRRNVYTIS